MQAKKRKKYNIKYLPLEDIKDIDDKFLTEIENVKRRLTGVSDMDVINAFYDVISNGYAAAIELRAREREVDYDIKLAEIEARTLELKPWRGGWWRRLFFFLPLTNRAQDIIEERAGLDADIIHTAAEKKIDEDEKKYFPETEKTLTRRELKRLMHEKLRATVDEADKTNTNEVFEELPVAPPLSVQTSPENAEKPAKQLPGQMTLDELQTQALEQTSPQPTNARRPRPPRSCRKQ
ncbi:MAG: hypothetical protein K2L42_07120 [Clostridia bacterium]|nr:hypothetical protein [Clostridia bacterium]